MARPYKAGLDYFPFDVDADQDDKLYFVEAKHPHGFKVIVKLWMAIYKDGYFKRWTDRDAVVFAGKKGLELDDVRAVVASALECGLFSRELYEQHEILTSAAVQKRYLKSCEKRKRMIIEDSYKLFELIEVETPIQRRLVIVSGEKTLYAGELTGNNSESTPQSKGEQRREEERRAEQSKGGIDNDGVITPEELRSAVVKHAPMGLTITNQMIKEMSSVFKSAPNLRLDYVLFFAEYVHQQSKLENPAGYFRKHFGEQVTAYLAWRVKQATKKEPVQQMRTPPTPDEEEQVQQILANPPWGNRRKDETSGRPPPKDIGIF